MKQPDMGDDVWLDCCVTLRDATSAACEIREDDMHLLPLRVLEIVERQVTDGLSPVQTQSRVQTEQLNSRRNAGI